MKFNNPLYENEELTYQDVFLFQNYFDWYSRSEVNIQPKHNFWTQIPIVSANMNAVTWKRMAETIARYWWLWVLPQDMNIDTLVEIVNKVKSASTKYDTPITVKATNTIRDAMWIIHKRSHNRVIMINDDTSRRLCQLANASRDGEIISLNEALQNYIYTSQFNLQLNQDDLF